MLVLAFALTDCVGFHRPLLRYGRLHARALLASRKLLIEEGLCYYYVMRNHCVPSQEGLSRHLL